MVMAGLPHNAAWVRPYLESPWVTVAAKLAPTFPSPVDHASGKVWMRFSVACFGGALGLVVLGIFVSGAVLTRAFCCLSARVHARPSMAPLVCVSLLTGVVIAAGTLAYLLLGQKGMAVFEAELADIASQAQGLEREGDSLLHTASGAASALAALVTKCHDDAARPQLEESSRWIESATTAMRAYIADISQRRARLQYALAGVQDMARVVIFGLAIPASLVLVCCAALACAVHRARTGMCCGDGHCCCACCVRGIGAFLFAPAILLVLLAAAGEFGTSLALASFCKDVDRNVVTYVKHLASEVGADEVIFYVSAGESGHNPLLERLHQATSALGSVREIGESGEDHIKAICPNAEEEVDDIVRAVGASMESLHVAERALGPDNVYPRYDAMVRHGVCQTVVGGLAWLVLCQVVAGVVLLPTQAFMAHRLLEHVVAWRASMLHKLAD